MSNLTRYDNDGLELVINTVTGEAFASISAVARMTDKNESTIRTYVNNEIKQSRFLPLKEVENLGTKGGKQSRILVIKH
jgi:hypothetical protein